MHPHAAGIRYSETMCYWKDMSSFYLPNEVCLTMLLRRVVVLHKICIVLPTHGSNWQYSWGPITGIRA